MLISLKNNWHQTIYFFLLCVFVVSIPLSNFFVSASLILLCVNWLWEGNFKQKFGSKRKNLVLFSLLSLFLIHIVWLINSENIAYGLDDIRKKLPLFAIPLILLTSTKLTTKQNNSILFIYCAAVLGGSLWGFIRYLAYDGALEYRDIFPFISHIRFCINICLVIVILFLHAINNFKSLRTRAISIFFVAWFIFFLLLLRSYTGVLILCILSIILYIFYFKKIKKKKIKWSILALFILFYSSVLGIGYFYVNQYYTPSVLAQKQKRTHTKQGNIYEYGHKSTFENGNYIYSYVCQKELKESWNKVSSIQYDSLDKRNQSIKWTLIRYLNSKDLTKDAEGISSLSNVDIKRIESGIGNVYYKEGNILEKMIYPFLYEYEDHKRSSNSKGYSFYQRVELWKTGIQIIRNHFWVGVGTGDVADAVKSKLIESDSQLKNTNLRCHNQYITFFMTFGIIGFLIFMFSLFYAPFKTKLFLQSSYFLCFFTIIAIAFISEDMLETSAGVTLFAFFYSFFIQNPTFVKNKIPQ